MSKVIMLRCESCGASLDVNDALPRATCNHCGAVMVIQRSDNVGVLDPIHTAAVATQTTKVAAELAIVRLKEELHDLTTKAKSLSNDAAADKGNVGGGGAGCVAMGIGCFVLGLASDNYKAIPILIGILLIGGGAAWMLKARLVFEENQQLIRNELANTERDQAKVARRLAEQRNIVDSYT